jgi:methionyl-tRNA formyltransferase
MRAQFMGTPEAAVAILEALGEIATVTGVVTRPDRPRGRSGRLVPPPVKVRAGELGLAIDQPRSGAEVAAAVEASGADIVVVAAYGRLITPEVLAIPPRGFVNVHFSLLPRWRGASPVVRTLLAGDTETGVSLMEMDEGLDTGPIIATARRHVGATDTAGSLTRDLAALGADLLRRELPRYLAGELVPVPQDDAAATAAAKVTVEEAHVDPVRHSSEAVDRAVRAFDPRPGAWCLVEGGRIKLWRIGPAQHGPEPGLAVVRDDSVILGTRDGAVELLEVQPAGRGRMAAAAWMNGRRGEPARLE